MKFWIVTALDSDAQRFVVGQYCSDDLARQAVELCCQLAALTLDGSPAWTEAEYSDVYLKYHVSELEAFVAEAKEARELTRSVESGALTVAEEAN